MAEDKKGFLLYADQIHIFESLEDEEAGQLIKHILKYVNDHNPEAPNKLIKIAFEPIKHQLKRDLLKYEGKKKKYSDAGKAGAEAKRLAKEEAERRSATFSDAEQPSTKSAVTVNGTVSVNGTVTGNVKVPLSTKSKKAVDKSPPHPAFTKCVDFWLKEFHPGWTFTAAKGKALNSLIKKIEFSLKERELEITPEAVLHSFTLICQKLPEFFKNKDIETIDSKFNEIITEIKNPSKNGKTKQNAADLAAEAVAISRRNREKRNAANG